jgi:hypothetical protein
MTVTADQEIIDALIAYATQGELGDDISWDEIELARDRDLDRG